MSFATPDPACIRRWGETVIHKPAAGGTDNVTVIRVDPVTIQAQGAILCFFGTMVDSEFRVTPAKDDVINADGEDYRVYDVRSDWPGGTVPTAGLWLYLTQVEG